MSDNILIVDDGAGTMICMMLERIGYSTSLFTKVKEATNAIHSGREYGLALIDLYLQNNFIGDFVVGASRRANPEVPIIVITSYTDYEIKKNNFDIGSVNHKLTKPFDDQDLLSLIERYVSKKT